MELLNIDELAKIAASAPFDPSHEPLVSGLRDRYPESEFIYVGARGGLSLGMRALVDAQGKKISDDFEQWLVEQYETSGKDHETLWQMYKDSGLMLSRDSGQTLYIAVPYISDPDGFIQIEVDAIHEVTYMSAFDPMPPERFEDLKYPMSAGVDEMEIAPWRYRIGRVADIRRFVRNMAAIYHEERRAKLPEMEQRMIRLTEMSALKEDGSIEYHQESTDIPFLEMFPDWLTAEHPGVRFLRDWQESSAGRSGHRFCEHWWLQLTDYTDYKGVRHMTFAPQLAEKDARLSLPEIWPDEEDSPHQVMQSLLQFDSRAGYPMAWYFYILHGHRVFYTAGKVIARAISEVKIRLPECDEKVLLRWDRKRYCL